jgi:DNA-binding MarR family transcriptional regulator
MTDINIRQDFADDEKFVQLVELLFFAYRDFIGDPDEILAKIGFGRAHHRIIHFVGRNPGMRVAELLSILKITKQSLGRVLRELVERGYVVQREGESDRRQRLLYLTAKGRELHSQLLTPQLVRVRRAVAGAGSGGEESYRSVLTRMIDSEGSRQLALLHGRAEPK